MVACDIRTGYENERGTTTDSENPHRRIQKFLIESESSAQPLQHGYLQGYDTKAFGYKFSTIELGTERKALDRNQ